MVNYLRRHGIVTASGSGRKGRGLPLKYTYADLLLLRVIAKLLAQGISVLRLRKGLSSLQRQGRNIDKLLTSKYVATDGYNIYFADDDILEMLGTGQMAFAFIFELNLIKQDVDKRVALPAKRAFK